MNGLAARVAVPRSAGRLPIGAASGRERFSADREEVGGEPLPRRIVRDGGRGLAADAEGHARGGAGRGDRAVERDAGRRHEVEGRALVDARERLRARLALEREAEERFLADDVAVGIDPGVRLHALVLFGDAQRVDDAARRLQALASFDRRRPAARCAP